MKSIAELQQLAESGDLLSLYLLGRAFTNGEGVAKQMAVRWFVKAADQGQAMAQHNLGICYCNGIGVAMDKERSKRLFIQAAQNGFQPARDACAELGLKY